MQIEISSIHHKKGNNLSLRTSEENKFLLTFDDKFCNLTRSAIAISMQPHLIMFKKMAKRNDNNAHAMNLLRRCDC